MKELVYIKQGNELVCPKCGKVCIQLISEQLPRMSRKLYPNGVCKPCKKKILIQLRSLLSGGG